CRSGDDGLFHCLFRRQPYVLSQLAKYRQGEVHLRASYICTRADVLANVAVFISGAIVSVTGFKAIDLIVGFADYMCSRKPLRYCNSNT
ncbi:hypothetical protein ABTM22_20085, partial [Acinetobacter baumannii]